MVVDIKTNLARSQAEVLMRSPVVPSLLSVPGANAGDEVTGFKRRLAVAEGGSSLSADGDEFF